MLNKTLRSFSKFASNALYIRIFLIKFFFEYSFRYYFLKFAYMYQLNFNVYITCSMKCNLNKLKLSLSMLSVKIGGDVNYYVLEEFYSI